MFKNMEDMQKLGKEQMEAATAASAALTKNLQQIASEATEYSKKSLETSTAALQKLMSAKSADAAFQIQSDYVKSAYEAFVAQASKMGELYTNLAKDAFKPVEAAVARAKAAK